MLFRSISTPRPDTSTQAFLHPQLFPYIQTADHTLRNPDFSGVSEYEQPRTGEAGCREILNASTFAVPRRTTPDSGGRSHQLRNTNHLLTDLLWVILVPPIMTFAWLFLSKGWSGLMGTTDSEAVRGWTTSLFWVVLSSLYSIGFVLLVYKYFFM